MRAGAVFYGLVKSGEWVRDADGRPCVWASAAEAKAVAQSAGVLGRTVTVCACVVLQ